MSRRFVDELLVAATGDEATRRRVEQVLRQWAGQQVYIGRTGRDQRRAAAEQMLRAGVACADAVDILVERFGLSRRHCRRIVRAVNISM
jgi:3-hydroxyisobutyrate dehydrogenase-like beta-hydroxyacid dehydrogenase